MVNVPEMFGSAVFNDESMKKYLPKGTYKELKKTIEDGRVTYIYRHSLRNHNDHEWEYENDEKRNELFDGLDDFLCDLFDRFLEDNMPDVPLDWNWFSFSLDSLTESVKYGEWVPASDGSMNFGNYNEETKEYDEYVECM